MTKYLLPFILILVLFGCLRIDNQFKGMPDGIWQGTLYIDGKISDLEPFEKQNYKHQNVYKYKKGTFDLPFIFETQHPSPDSIILIIHNGEERIMVDDISFGTDKSTAKDTFLIRFPLYNTYITAVYEDGILEGEWHVPSKGNYSIPFVGRFGKSKRFERLNTSTTHDLSGIWSAQFDNDGETPTPAIGEFQQEGTRLTGTFMTETGDYRFLEGIVDGDEMMLSCFDGSHAFLFKANVYGDGSLKGTFKSGKHYTTQWEAVRNDSAQLSNPDTLTQLVPDALPLEFTLMQGLGDTIKYPSTELKGKPIILQIMGTWCSNCRDESNFLKDYLATHPSDDLQVIGVAYERAKNDTLALQHLAKYKQKLDLPYPITLGGQLTKTAVLEDFPQLNKIMSYPTMLFIDRKGQIQFIHTGFAGPATSEYAHFIQDFDEKVEILKRK